MSWQRWDESTKKLTLALHIQPGAKTTSVQGRHGDALKIRLAAPPVDGKANEALIAFLSDVFAVPQAHVVIARGASARRKLCVIDSPNRRPDVDWLKLP